MKQGSGPSIVSLLHTESNFDGRRIAACESGNLLIIPYRELRLLEIEILKSLCKDYNLSLDLAHMSKIDVVEYHTPERGVKPCFTLR